jgi:hypothetical protein
MNATATTTATPRLSSSLSISKAFQSACNRDFWSRLPVGSVADVRYRDGDRLVEVIHKISRDEFVHRPNLAGRCWSIQETGYLSDAYYFCI